LIEELKLCKELKGAERVEEGRNAHEEPLKEDQFSYRLKRNECVLTLRIEQRVALYQCEAFERDSNEVCEQLKCKINGLNKVRGLVYSDA